MNSFIETNTTITTNRFLEQVYKSLTHEVTFPSLNTHGMLTNIMPTQQQHIDQIVEFEMKRIQENCQGKQEQYVEQMLAENPIAIGRRTNTTNTTTNSSSILSGECDTLLSTEQKRQQHGQRSEACRRSRYNNKIKKAKSKYRHKYMSQKLLQSTQLLTCIKDLIAQTEGHLLAQGLGNDKLHKLRYSYGMDSTRREVRGIEMDTSVKTKD
ncbi:protein sisterless A-like [Musca vetustissima]|uniref:protein sisterless A-like n=1 Tax=Musca vetustissima TaxID=27455 RepID=UPI002AB63B33|nr:protein sisterless A-like [Musca vetustissima]